MALRRIDRDLDNLISNLKLTKPNRIQDVKNISVSQKQQNTTSFTSSLNTPLTTIQSAFFQQTYKQKEQPIWKQLTSNSTIPNNINPLSEYDSVVNDNYDDTNNYSFYQLKDLKTNLNQPQSHEFSFCQQFESQNIIYSSNDDSLNKFSSIVDKLKTQGDQCDSIDGNFFYDHYDQPHSHQVSKTDRYTHKDQPYFSQSENPRMTNLKKTQYFSGSMLKSTQKSYKTISKKTFQPSFSKPKAQPIYAKLILNHDKENNHQNSNICSKSSVISSLTTKKSNYSSAMKKPFNPVAKSSVKSTQQCPLSKVKVKELNQKIRKENQIVYTSELKQKYQDVSPLQSFKKSTIQPHKFSSYKVKLFG